MSENLKNFTNRVSVDGYKIIEATYEKDKGEPELYVVEKNSNGPVVPISPFDKGNLIYMELVDDKMLKEGSLDTESLLGFISKYGLLQEPAACYETGSGDMYYGQRVESWLSNVESLKRITHQISIMREKHQDLLKTITSEEMQDYWIKNIHLIHGPGDYLNELDDRAMIIDIITRYTAAINVYIERSSSSSLTFDRGNFSVSTKIVTFDCAIWMQYAEVLSRNAKIKQCSECNNWFEVSTAAARTNRKYCSNACKVKAYRKRKEQKE